MDRLEFFRHTIQAAIRSWAEFLKPDQGMENALVFDENTDNYVYIYTGWKNDRHINATIVHIGIRGGKIHIFHDGIEDSIVNDLLEAGVLESEIVIERHPPYARQFTPFAVS